MAQVEINITGNRGGGTPPPPNPNPDDNRGGGGGRTPVPPPIGSGNQPDPRLIEDVRRAIIQQGAVYIPPGSGGAFRPIIQQAEKNERQRINDDITKRYEERRDDAYKRMEAEYKRIDQSTTMTEEEKNAATIRAGQLFDRENETIDREEAEERQQANDDLTRVIEELTEEIRRSGGNLNPNSFLSQLRAERQKAIVERDTAEDEETARQAAARVRELDKQINSVVKGDEEDEKDKGDDYRLRSIQGILGINQVLSGIGNRSFSGTLSGLSQTAMSMLPKGGRVEQAGSIVGAVIALLGGAVDQMEKSNEAAGLASLLRREYGGNVSLARQSVLGDLSNFSPYDWLPSINEIGLDAVDFAQSAERRIKARGMAEGGVTEAYYQEMLERMLSLNSGALEQASKYDRYGINVTDAFSRLIDRLERVNDSGITKNNYARAQEYLNLQQQLMGQYSSFTARPDYNVANKELVGIASMSGYTVNQNTANDLNIARNAIVNPQNDRLRAILYSTVEEMDSSVAGRYDLIERALNDPEKQGMIMREYFRKIQSMYGGTDTQMGFNAFRNILPGMTIDQMDAFVRGITSPTDEGGRIFSSIETQTGNGDKINFAHQAEGYNTLITSGMASIGDDIKDILGQISRFFTKAEVEGIKVKTQ